MKIVLLYSLQTLHSLGANRLEMINSISGYVEERVLPVLKDVDKCWQPADLLPDPASDTFLDEVRPLTGTRQHV